MRCYTPFIYALSFVFTACGGGGGGSANSSAPLPPFIQSSSIVVPSTVRIDGSSQQVNYNSDTNRVTSISAATAFSSDASYVATYGSDSLTTKAVLTSATGTNISIDTANGDRIGFIAAFPRIDLAITANGTDRVLSARPAAYGWDYQTFGVWTTGYATGSGTFGVASFGATGVSDIPDRGTGTFIGFAGGRYVDSSGADFFVGSDMTASTNFGTRSIAFSTTNARTSADLQTSTPNANLNTSGTLSYSAGVNQFTGAVTTVGGGASNAAMTGNATGKFYGPAAQEIGGTFSVSGGGAAYLGAFGGKR